MQQRQVRDIEYQLLPGTERQTTDIVIERDGVITVRPPRWMTPEQVDDTVLSKRMWIYRNLAEWRELNVGKVEREWVNGESFLYLGRQYRLQLVADQPVSLQLKNGRFCLSQSVLLQGNAAAHHAFEAFYMAKGAAIIDKRVALYAAKVGVTPGKIAVKDIGFKWATCHRNGDLQFHWKCLLAPLTIVDYIVVHELCHLHRRDHSDAFWNEVDKVMPDYRTRKAWLRVNGATL